MSTRASAARVLRAIVLLGALASASIATAQAPSASTAKALQGDYAVPDAPALVILGISDSKLLRPSSAQQLTSNIISSLSALTTTPQAFAVEFSPFMLKQGPQLSIGEYQAHPLLYRTRLSFGANRDAASQRAQVALGLRLSLDDQADLRTNTEFLAAIDKLTALKVDSARAVLAELSAHRIPRVGALTPAQQATKDSIIAALATRRAEARDLTDSLQSSGTDMTNAVAAVKRAKEATTWNASVTDVAAAVRVSSRDSVNKGARFDGVSGWATKGVAVGNVAQLLLGFRGAYERDSSVKAALHGTGDVVARMYAGSNLYKVSFEAQGTGRETARPNWAFKIGGEFEATKSLWIDFSAGWTATGSLGGGVLTHSVSFHVAPPNQ
jgi:hypothetical protein